MTRALQAGRRDARSGTARSVLVFLHGYGADGNDLLGLADPLAPHLPDTVFLAPDAPEPNAFNPSGRQWFSLPWIDGSPPEAMAAGMAAAAADLDAWLDGVLAAEGIAADRLALLGFSQGTMMALEVAPRRPAALSCLVGFSGRLVAPERLAGESVSRMPVLLLHGDADDVVPFASLPEAADALSGAGFEVYTHVMQGTGHGIDPQGLGVALGFLRRHLGYETA